MIVSSGLLLAGVELKAHVGPSFGNNFNNRVEEALGSSLDLLTAYREGRFQPSARPWLGWLMLLEDVPASTVPVKAADPHFAVFPEFREASYAQRYGQFCRRLVRERLYDATCLLLSNAKDGKKGLFSEPDPETAFDMFAAQLTAHLSAYARLRDMGNSS